MRKQLMKGNEAIVKSAILAGCRAFYGYPITPASEIAEAAAELMPKAGGVFLQAESEVAALYGAVLRGGALHDRLQRPRDQPHAGRHQLHGWC
jgi:pyruvate/2-oxoacid:ferredoxin oxidoreductase alpha subunit